MNCKDTEKMIPEFLQDDLDSRELKSFIEHMDSCPECMEELSIQFLVSEGLERLEKGNNFNLQSALSKKMMRARHEIKVNRTLRRLLICLEAAVAAAVIISSVILYSYVL